MIMKKPIALVLALYLARSLAACNDSGNAPSRSTTSPTNAKPLPHSLQGDAGSTYTEDMENISADITATSVYVRMLSLLLLPAD